MSEVQMLVHHIAKADWVYPEVLEVIKEMAREEFERVHLFPPRAQVVVTEAGKTYDFLLTEGQECPECEGTGVIWDETACGDPDHCSPTFDCAACEGTGGMKAEGETT